MSDAGQAKPLMTRRTFSNAAQLTRRLSCAALRARIRLQRYDYVDSRCTIVSNSPGMLRSGRPLILLSI